MAQCPVVGLTHIITEMWPFLTCRGLCRVTQWLAVCVRTQPIGCDLTVNINMSRYKLVLGPEGPISEISLKGTKGDPVLLLVGCLRVMEIPGLSSKNAAILLFHLSFQKRLTHFLAKIFDPYFQELVHVEGKITQYFNQIMFACY